MLGPPVLFPVYGWSVAFAKPASQPMWAFRGKIKTKQKEATIPTLGPALSANPMAYQMQASQWATKAKADMRRMRTAAPYSEYLSIFRATRTSRSRRAVFSKPINVVVWKRKYFIPPHNRKYLSARKYLKTYHYSLRFTNLKYK